MKKIFAAALALVLALSVIGCSVAPSAGEGDTAVVDSDEAVATIGDRKVTFGEYKQLFDAYAQYYAMMGYDISADEEGTKQLQDSIIDALVVNEIIAYQAAQSGYDKLSDEKLAEIEEQAAADLNSIVEEYRKQAESDAEADSGIDVEERLAEYIADEAEAYTGERMTAEEYGKWILENSTESAIGEAFKEAMLKDVTVSDDEIKSWYDENLKTQQEAYDKNPENYKEDKEAEELYGGDPVLYVPEGYSRVLHILITPEDAISDEYSEKFSEMEDLKSEYGELAFTVNVEGGEGADRLSEIKTEYNKLKTDADKIKDEYLAPSVEKAKEAYAKLQAGEEFSKVAEEYSPDTEGNENGLLISVKHSGSYDWSKEVKDAFAKIKQGEYTEPVKDDEGVHILYYLSDEPAGEVGLDSVKDKIKEILLLDVQEDEWNQMLETWKNDESVSLNEELVRSVTYSPAAVG